MVDRHPHRHKRPVRRLGASAGLRGVSSSEASPLLAGVSSRILLRMPIRPAGGGITGGVFVRVEGFSRRDLEDTGPFRADAQGHERISARRAAVLAVAGS